MLRRMYAVLTGLEPTAPTHYWPVDTMKLNFGEIQKMAGSVSLKLVDVISPDQVPEQHMEDK